MAVTISERQRDVHLIAEAAAVLLVVPFLGRVATRKGPLTPADRLGLGVIMASTLAIDGGLLLEWYRRYRRG